MARKKILLINPNSSECMTESIFQMINQLSSILPFSTMISTYTAPPSAPPSINNDQDALQSANIVLLDLEPKIAQWKYDGYLVACYSQHPLVDMLKKVVEPNVHVLGIFEASVLTAMSLLRNDLQDKSRNKSGFGIITTGKYWEVSLRDGVKRLLGWKPSEHASSEHMDPEDAGRLCCVESTGLDADQLHTASPQEVNMKLKMATSDILNCHDEDNNYTRQVTVICLGCAGMVGLEGIVREACIEARGVEEGEKVHIVDGVKAGLGMLETLIRTCPRKEKQEVIKDEGMRVAMMEEERKKTTILEEVTEGGSPKKKLENDTMRKGPVQEDLLSEATIMRLKAKLKVGMQKAAEEEASKRPKAVRSKVTEGESPREEKKQALAQQEASMMDGGSPQKKLEPKKEFKW